MLEASGGSGQATTPVLAWRDNQVVAGNRRTASVPAADADLYDPLPRARLGRLSDAQHIHRPVGTVVARQGMSHVSFGGSR